MSKRKRYTDEFRANTVLLLEAAGYPDKTGALTEVAKTVKVPAMTISRWFKGTNHAPPNNVVKAKKEDLLSLIENELVAILGFMPDTYEEASLRDLGTVFGILADKLQLLSGKATERTEIVGDISYTERSARIIALLDSARDRRDRHSSAG